MRSEYNLDCVKRINANRKKHFFRFSNTVYKAESGQALICVVSKKIGSGFWYGIGPKHIKTLNASSKYGAGYLVFGCGSAKKTLQVPYSVFKPLLRKIPKGKYHYHVHIKQQGRTYSLIQKGGDLLDWSKYLVD